MIPQCIERIHTFQYNGLTAINFIPDILCDKARRIYFRGDHTPVLSLSGTGPLFWIRQFFNAAGIIIL